MISTAKGQKTLTDSFFKEAEENKKTRQKNKKNEIQKELEEKLERAYKDGEYFIRFQVGFDLSDFETTNKVCLEINRELKDLGYSTKYNVFNASWGSRDRFVKKGYRFHKPIKKEAFGRRRRIEVFIDWSDPVDVFKNDENGI